MLSSKQIDLPRLSFSLFLRTQNIGPSFGAWGMMLDRMAVRAVVTIQQFCSHAATLPIESLVVPLASISSQDCLARFPMGRSERTLHAQTSDHGSINAKSVPAVQGIKRG